MLFQRQSFNSIITIPSIYKMTQKDKTYSTEYFLVFLIIISTYDPIIHRFYYHFQVSMLTTLNRLDSCKKQ